MVRQQKGMVFFPFTIASSVKFVLLKKKGLINGSIERYDREREGGITPYPKNRTKRARRNCLSILCAMV
jgi:hypothetical protein